MKFKRSYNHKQHVIVYLNNNLVVSVILQVEMSTIKKNKDKRRVLTRIDVKQKRYLRKSGALKMKVTLCDLQ